MENSVSNYKRAASFLLRKLRVDLKGLYSFTTSDGCRFWLDRNIESHSLWLVRNLLQRDDVHVFLHNYLRPGNVFVDIGANVGAHSVHAGRLVGPSGKVFSVEPSALSYKALLGNLKLNQAVHVQPFCKAVGEQDMQMEFWEYADSVLNGFYPRADRKDAALSYVQTIRGDHLLRKVEEFTDTVDVLKIDVEGAELSVLRSFGDRLHQLECILLECSRANLHRAGQKPDDIIVFLRENGFHIFEIDSKNKLFINLTQLKHYNPINKDLIAHRDLSKLQERTSWQIFSN